MAGTAARADDAPPSGERLLREARAAFHARPRPAFVVYTLERRDRIDGIVDLENTYTLRIWCRTADGAALARRVMGAGPAGGDLQGLVVRFDDRVDPGPPTADLFQPARARTPRGDPIPDPTATAYAEIGRIVVPVETEYRVISTARDGDAWHLELEPRRDPDRNRVRELWTDAATGMPRRVVLTDHLYTPEETIPERFDVRLALREGVPVVETIGGRSVTISARAAGAPRHEVDYRFTRIAFPATLPDWYFAPATYGAHRAEAPA